MSKYISQIEANDFFNKLNEAGKINKDNTAPAYIHLSDISGIDKREARLLFLNWADKKFNTVED